eukprot:UN29733
MIELLNYALEDSARYATSDKFVFISDSTIPLQPFDETYRTITESPESKFCLTGTDQWAVKDGRVAVKSTQWIILNQFDATKAVRGYNDMNGVDFENKVYRQEPISWQHMKEQYPDENQKRRSLWFPKGCLDEYFFFAVIYGNILEDEFNEGIKDDLETINLSINQCSTYVYWKDADDQLSLDLIDKGKQC